MIFGLGNLFGRKAGDIDRIVERVCNALALDRSRVAMRPIATGKFNRSFELGEQGGKQYVLRVAPPDDTGFLFYEKNMMRQEPAIADRLLRETGVPVARVAYHDLTRETVPTDFLVMEKLPGKPLSEMGSRLSGDRRDELMRQVGDCLRQVHALSGEAFGYVGPHRPMEPQKTWADAFEIMWAKLADDVVNCGGYPRSMHDAVRGMVSRHKELFDYAGSPAMLHMDVWSQNILVDDEGRLTGLIDWDRALYGDPGIEFSVLDYCGISCDALTAGYGRAREASVREQLRQMFYYLYEHQKYIVINALRRKDAARAQSYAADSKSALKSLAQVVGDREVMSVLLTPW